MIKKESLTVKLIKRFYGITGVLDEYKQQEVNRIGNNAFMLLWWYLLIANFLACLFAFRFPEVTLLIYISCNLIFGIFVIGGYVMVACAKSKLTEVEIESTDTKYTKGKLVRSALYSGIYFAILFHILKGFLTFFSENANFLSEITTPKNIISSAFAGILFGGFMYIMIRNRVKRISDK